MANNILSPRKIAMLLQCDKNNAKGHMNKKSKHVKTFKIGSVLSIN